jgi:hypothetical protein
VTTTSTEYEMAYVFPLDLGTFQIAGQLRYLSIAPMIESDNVARTVGVLVTSSAVPPIGSSSLDYYWPGSFRQVTFATTSTTPVVATADDLLPVLGPGGLTWITISLKISSAGTATLYGLPTFYLKAGA